MNPNTPSLSVIAMLSLATVLATTAPAAENPPICGDLNDSGGVTSTDALALLRYAVGQPVSLVCPDYLERYGFDVDRGFTAPWSPDYLFGVRVSVATSVTVTHLGMYSREATGHAKMALYTDDGGVPDALVARTTGTALVIGANEMPVVESKPISPGFYWITIVLDEVTDIGGNDQATADNVAIYRNLDFDLGLPDPIGPTISYPSSTLDFWMKVIQ